MKLLEGKVALITGASRGIGQAVARRFAEHGAIVLLNGRSDPAALAELAAELTREFGVEAVPYCYDVADRPAVQSTFADIFKRFKRLDVLVNNAGILVDAFLGMISDDVIQSVMNVNTVGPILHMQEAARLMARKQSGSIINLSSIIGRVGNTGQTVYGASKAAVIGMTLSAAKELAPKGIRVNAIAPGFIETDMVRKLPPAVSEERVRSIKMGRLGQPEDVAMPIVFLASDWSRYVTGQVIGVDGGMLI